MSSYLTVKEGIYDPSKRFAFKNITEDEFVFTWGGLPIKVKAGQEIELPHHLAVLATKRLVDQIMTTEVKEEEVKMRAKNKDPLWRSPRGLSVGIPDARKIYEDKVLRELKVDDENPQMAIIRAQIREDLMKDLSAEKAAPVTKISVGKEEFSEIKSK